MGRVARVGLLLPLLSGCGGAQQSDAADPATVHGGSYPLSPAVETRIAQRSTVVHLTSIDDKIGLVLDQSGASPRIQLDGTSDVIELAFAGSRMSKDVRLGTVYMSSAGHRLEISTRGHYRYFDREVWVEMTIDRSAAPLAPPAAAPAR